MNGVEVVIVQEDEGLRVRGTRRRVHEVLLRARRRPHLQQAEEAVGGLLGGEHAAA